MNPVSLSLPGIPPYPRSCFIYLFTSLSHGNFYLIYERTPAQCSSYPHIHCGYGTAVGASWHYRLICVVRMLATRIFLINTRCGVRNSVLFQSELMYPYSMKRNALNLSQYSVDLYRVKRPAPATARYSYIVTNSGLAVGLNAPVVADT